MSGDAHGYDVRFMRGVRHAVAELLPEAVAAAVIHFCATELATNPHRVGKPLVGPFEGCLAARRGTYRIVYRVDDPARTVHMLDVAHRGTVCRPR